MKILAFILLISVIYDSLAALAIGLANIELIRKHKRKFLPVVKDFILNVTAAIFFIVFMMNY